MNKGKIRVKDFRFFFYYSIYYDVNCCKESWLVFEILCYFYFFWYIKIKLDVKICIDCWGEC